MSACFAASPRPPRSDVCRAILSLVVLAGLSGAALGQPAVDEHLTTVNGLKIPIIPRPKGPDLIGMADEEWDEFKATLPGWFRARLNQPSGGWTAESTWIAPMAEVEGCFPDDLDVRHRTYYSKEGDRCYVTEKYEVWGRMSTVRWATLVWVLEVDVHLSDHLLKADRAALLLFWNNNVRLVAGASDKPIPQLMVEAIPVLGEAVDAGGSLSSIKAYADRSSELLDELLSFQKELKYVEAMVRKRRVVELRGDYENGVVVESSLHSDDPEKKMLLGSREYKTEAE